jgi:hypothetical protein
MIDLGPLRKSRIGPSEEPKPVRARYDEHGWRDWWWNRPVFVRMKDGRFLCPNCFNKVWRENLSAGKTIESRLEKEIDLLRDLKKSVTKIPKKKEMLLCDECFNQTLWVREHLLTEDDFDRIREIVQQASLSAIETALIRLALSIAGIWLAVWLIGRLARIF